MAYDKSLFMATRARIFSYLCKKKIIYVLTTPIDLSLFETVSLTNLVFYLLSREKVSR